MRFMHFALDQVTEQFSDDFEAWIELAQILEQNDLQGSLRAYDKACKIMKENVRVEIPSEILNNMASLKYRCVQLL